MGTKIGTLKDRETGDDFLPRTDSSLVTGLEDLPTIRRLSNGALQYTFSGEAEPVNPAQYESTTNKTTELDNESTNTEYPSAKAVVDALGKWGVVSQTQTWTGSSDTGFDYTMSNIVRGLIPQYFIDRATSHPQIIFNENTGYFELNGLTDISYKEMQVIVEDFAITMGLMGGDNGIGALTHGRTLIPDNTIGTISLSYSFYNRQAIEVIVFGWNSGSTQTSNVISSMCRSNYRLKTIERLALTATTAANVANAFSNCYSLENATIRGVRIDLDFSQSSRLSLASVVYMVDYAYANSTFTLTLHATAYARCQADTTTYTYNGNTYTGILAYASAKNITIASA